MSKTPHRTAPFNRELADGSEDALEPLASLDPVEIDSFDGMLKAMSQTAFSGRSLGEAADVLTEMVNDPDCTVIATFSGAMTVAKMGVVIVRMIEAGMIQGIVSTGALMAHGLSEAVGLQHFKVNPRVPDEVLFKKGYNRVYDTLELETNLNKIEEFLRKQLDQLPTDKPWCSEQLCRVVGKALADSGDSPGILRSAYLHNVPVYVPAFTDSELGLDLLCWKLREEGKKRATTRENVWEVDPAPFNPFYDLVSYAKLVRRKPRLGIFTIGGGVPRNWAQQVAPLYDIVSERLDIELERPRFRYGVRICPEPVHWGGLSGCTYSEGVSWGKFMPKSEGGRFAEVYADATVVWPMLIRGVLERLGKLPKQP